MPGKQASLNDATPRCAGAPISGDRCGTALTALPKRPAFKTFSRPIDAERQQAPRAARPRLLTARSPYGARRVRLATPSDDERALMASLVLEGGRHRARHRGSGGSRTPGPFSRCGLRHVSSRAHWAARRREDRRRRGAQKSAPQLSPGAPVKERKKQTRSAASPLVEAKQRRVRSDPAVDGRAKISDRCPEFEVDRAVQRVERELVMVRTVSRRGARTP
jgi:hypothetical protein